MTGSVNTTLQTHEEMNIDDIDLIQGDEHQRAKGLASIKLVQVQALSYQMSKE